MRTLQSVVLNSMDSSPTTAGILTIGSSITASLKIILKLRGTSDEIQALMNEISDLSAVIKDVEHTLRYNQNLNAESQGVASLHTVLSKANNTINHLQAYVSNVLIKKEDSVEDMRISRKAWLRDKPQILRYQRQLYAISQALSRILSLANR